MIRSQRSTIVLVGPMGAGKSTVGRQLASILKWEFLDTDRELEARCGADIPWIFDIEGEEGFRRREAEIISELVSRSDIVLATGGGAVLSDENRSAMRRSGTIIYLTAPMDALFQRVAKDKTRPLLQVENPRDTYQKIFLKRDPLYRKVADHVVVTDNDASPMAVAQSIVDLLNTD